MQNTRSSGKQRWPESLFQIPTPLLFQNFWIKVRIRVRQFFKFENLIPVQTPAAIINPTVIYPCFYLKNANTDSCYCQNLKVAPGPVFPKFMTPVPDPGPKEKRRIRQESTPALRFHLCWKNTRTGWYQWCTGSGFWSPIRPDINNFLIGYRFRFNRIRDRIIQIKKTVDVQKLDMEQKLCQGKLRSLEITLATIFLSSFPW